MRQYVLTRSAYGPAWERSSNRRRLAMTRIVTARLLELQTVTDWTWVVLLEERDPLLRDRLALYADSAPRFVPLVGRAPDPPRRFAAAARQRIAADSYAAPWRDAVGPADDLVIMSRLDDDDGLAPDALERFRRAAVGLERRTILMLPSGVWTWAGTFSSVVHVANAMHALVTPLNDHGHVYQYPHTKARTIAPVIDVDDAWGWLWVRHADTISGARTPLRWGDPARPVCRAVRTAFPIDWPALRAAWRDPR